MIKIPINMVYDILSASDLFKGVNIHLVDVDEDYQKLTALPIVRVNEINSYQNGFASNLANSMSITVQVDIWIRSYKDANKYYYEIDKIMNHNGWACNLSGVDRDKDFNNILRIYKRYTTSQKLNFA
ncbi:hypothetical protein A374_08739 [Fictibacillus macauensis ZFHKF-1]|uniref:Uncharacterized protein n=1 Tax=Fictibacillus macauensis ZFHKF-1 TaxID=1196324 RepID=I8AK30_9BACL|nr:hypothetical protein [Fictibacillus macauensis]EIT85909.1 hypothetical protein A374_08739 [Fictibacillus macauensis ZFHKF-1]